MLFCFDFKIKQVNHIFIFWWKLAPDNIEI